MFAETLSRIRMECRHHQATLVAVSKTRSVKDIREVYDAGVNNFGENYASELCKKHSQLPADIRWHFIGHLQSNKVKMIAPFVHLIHSVDSHGLLDEIEKQGARLNRTISCLVQVHIAQEESKFGVPPHQVIDFFGRINECHRPHVNIIGLMGMASLTDDTHQIRKEFRMLKSLYDDLKKSGLPFSVLSMGMTADYRIALEEGSNMVRIGSAIFGERN